MYVYNQNYLHVYWVRDDSRLCATDVYTCNTAPHLTVSYIYTHTYTHTYTHVLAIIILYLTQAYCILDVWKYCCIMKEGNICESILIIVFVETIYVNIQYLSSFLMELWNCRYDTSL